MSKDTISFFSEDVDFILDTPAVYIRWVDKLTTSFKKVSGEITYIFCSDSYLLKMNQDHLNHDTLTDIITFDYADNGIISGDIFISIDRVKENATDFNVDFNQELARVMAHGVLHIIGFKDKSKEDQEVMTQEEDKALVLYNSLI
jgi:probable rRNA maturation factor